MRIMYIIVFFLLLIGTGCNGNKAKSELINTVTVDPVVPSINNTANKLEEERETFSDLSKAVHEWNNANSAKDINILSQLYNDSVYLYRKSLDKSSCLNLKQQFFDKNPYFKQQIKGEIENFMINLTTYTCRFIKEVTLDEKTKEYQAYLVLSKINDRWKIVAESDLLTDKNILKQNTPKDAIKGDFNGDGKEEFVWIVSPDYNDFDCITPPCQSIICFSDPNLPMIPVGNCIGAILLENLGDLNGNGRDEIGLLPDWFTSCWRPFYVWTLKDKDWIYAIDPISTHCQQWEENVIPIEIDKEREGYVIIRFSEFINDYSDLVTSSKSVKIRK